MVWSINNSILKTDNLDWYYSLYPHTKILLPGKISLGMIATILCIRRACNKVSVVTHDKRMDSSIVSLALLPHPMAITAYACNSCTSITTCSRQLRTLLLLHAWCVRNSNPPGVCWRSAIAKGRTLYRRRWDLTPMLSQVSTMSIYSPLSVWICRSIVSTTPCTVLSGRSVVISTLAGTRV